MTPMLGALDASITTLVTDVEGLFTDSILPVAIVCLTAYVAFRLIRKYVK